MKKIEIYIENNNYSIDVIDENTYFAGTIIDLKRKQYYIILPDGFDKTSAEFLIENIINKIAIKKYNENNRVGSIKSNSAELLKVILSDLGFKDNDKKIEIQNIDFFSTTKENKNFLIEGKF